VGEAALWGLLSASSLLIGAFIALRWRLPPKPVGLVMAFGAGAMISAVSFELVEEGLEVATGTWVLGLGMGAGALTFFGGNWYIERQGGAKRKSVRGEHEDGEPSAIVLGTVLDGIPESIVIGGSLVVGGGVSVAMVAATFLSNLPEALGATTGLVKSGMAVPRVVLMWTGIVAVSAAAAAVGYLILEDASPNLAAFLQTFAAGAMLTMLAQTMIPEALKEGGSTVGLVTVLGFSVAVWMSSLE
jgi:ZIP family zinc transporter